MKICAFLEEISLLIFLSSFWVPRGGQSSNTSKKIEINGTFNCKTRNVVYCITCEHCKLQYIGQTRSLDERVREHIGYITNLHTNQPSGEHFNLSGHELSHLKVSVLEKVWDHGRSLLEVRESKYIRDFMTELRGMNRKK